MLPRWVSLLTIVALLNATAVIAFGIRYVDDLLPKVRTPRARVVLAVLVLIVALTVGSLVAAWLEWHALRAKRFARRWARKATTRDCAHRAGQPSRSA